jgi:hypothetical protein
LRKILQPETQRTALQSALVASMFLLFTGVAIGLTDVLPPDKRYSGKPQVVEPVRFNAGNAVNTIAASLQFGYHEKEPAGEGRLPVKIIGEVKTARTLKKAAEQKALKEPRQSHKLILNQVNNLFQKIATPDYPAATGTNQMIGEYFVSDSIPVFTTNEAESALHLQSFIQQVKEEASFSSLAGFWIVDEQATRFSSSGKITRLAVTRRSNPVSLQIME